MYFYWSFTLTTARRIRKENKFVYRTKTGVFPTCCYFTYLFLYEIMNVNEKEKKENMASNFLNKLCIWKNN